MCGDAGVGVGQLSVDFNFASSSDTMSSHCDTVRNALFKIACVTTIVLYALISALVVTQCIVFGINKTQQ